MTLHWFTGIYQTDIYTASREMSLHLSNIFYTYKDTNVLLMKEHLCLSNKDIDEM